jgi:hypothetical protein
MGRHIFANNYLSILDRPLKSEGLGRELSQVSGDKNQLFRTKSLCSGAYIKDRYFFCFISTSVPEVSAKIIPVHFANNSLPIHII